MEAPKSDTREWEMGPEEHGEPDTSGKHCQREYSEETADRAEYGVSAVHDDLPSTMGE
ncbi:MAG: hypothetical protein WAL25_13130 [Acidimicrobiia bacterium]